MSRIRLFFLKSLSLGTTDRLNKTQSHYLNKVMRAKVRDTFSLFNKGGEWEAEILKISNGIIEFKTNKQLRQKEHIKEFWLAFSPLKSNYQNFMIQKATELGITKFIPIIFDRSIVRKINLDRFKKILIEASEQSNRINIPSIERVQNLKDFLKINSMDLLFTDINSNNKKIDKLKFTGKPLCIIVGPEGDFSESEREQILNFKGVTALNLNDNILRSETAVISAISIVNYLIY